MTSLIALTFWAVAAYGIKTNVILYRSSRAVILPVQALDQPESGTFLIVARGLQDPNFA
jgi:hypothetical protein